MWSLRSSTIQLANSNAREVRAHTPPPLIFRICLANSILRIFRIENHTLSRCVCVSVSQRCVVLFYFFSFKISDIHRSYHAYGDGTTKSNLYFNLSSLSHFLRAHRNGVQAPLFFYYSDNIFVFLCLFLFSYFVVAVVWPLFENA